MWWRRPRPADAEYRPDPGYEPGKLKRAPEHKPDEATDPWAWLWPQTLVTPLFVGGPADGKRDAPRPRCELPLRIMLPVVIKTVLRVAGSGDPLLPVQPPIRAVPYRLGVYVDAFTVEYR